MRASLSVFVLVSTVFALGNGAKILAVFSMGAHSHFTLGFRLVKELTDRGHEVTFINAYPQKAPIKNLREISVAEIKASLEEKKKDLYEMGTMSYIGQLAWVSNFGHSYTEDVLKVKEVQKLLQSDEKFDLVLIEHFMNEAMAIFQHKFKCPSVVLAPGPTTVFNNHLFANPSQPAYVPSFLSNFGPYMTFWERIGNIYYDVVGELYVQLVSIPTQNDILQRTVPGAPDLRDILYDFDFLLLTSHISLREPSPHQPNIKEIGGYHLLPPKPLPKDIQEFLDSATDGAIIFSMGSNLKSADFPQEKKDAVLKVFSKLKQKVLWKFESDLPGKPDNVKILSWLPQQDCLAHPNVVAFITHVGLLGKIEAIYHGVPLLGLPVFWDQEKNIVDGVRQGFALSIPYPELTESNFDWALNELLNNPKYRENAKARQKIMRDQPVRQIDEAMFWIEYVIRHKGAPHLKSPALSLKWYQRLLLDIIVFASVVILTLSTVLIVVVKRIFRGSKKAITKKNKRE